MRSLSHLLLPRAALRRRFPSHVLTAIETAIVASETRHRGEIRFAIEVALDLRTLWRLRTAHERALEVFAELGVWNTAERNGVLIYVLLAERHVEVVADQGCHGRVSASEWQNACATIERDFAVGRWGDGALHGIEAVTELLAREFPAGGPNRNEQLDRPALL